MLLEDRDFACIYFSGSKLNDFDIKKLKELQKNLENAKAKYKEMMQLLSIVRFLNINSLIYKTITTMAITHQKWANATNNLDEFESSLAFLILTGIISTEKAEKLGFPKKYTTELLESHAKQLERPYSEYHYDEGTDITSKFTESGKMSILPYTPDTVKRKRAKIGNEQSYYKSIR